MSAVLGSVFLFAALLLYVPSPNLVLAAFVCAGAAFGFLWRQGRPREESGSPLYERMAAIGVAGALIILALVPAALGTKRLVSNTYVAYGNAVLAKGDKDAALAAAARAAKAEETSDALILQTTAGAEKLAELASSGSEPTENIRRQFTSLTQQSIAAGQKAQEKNPADYRPAMALGKIYDLLAALSVQGAAEGARSAYDVAAKLNPTSPQIPLLRAIFEARAGNIPQSQNYVSQALTLKPNYTDAMLFVVQTAAANNDLPSAIRAAKAASQTAPGVPSIWFQLGLLYYSQGSTREAIEPLRQAISLAPDYANAKYFLGLALAAQGQKQEALEIFIDLQKSNPDSAEVRFILNNLEQGKEPFAEAESPIKKPEQRPTAPIAE